MDAGMATIDVSVNGSALRTDHIAYIEDRLGPKPGKWDGYDDIADDEIRRDVWGKVGYIHGMSAEAGRSIVAVGQTLCEMKALLPHGQFMACVKAEFGWSQPWASQLMQVAERFSNHNSSFDLPSSAKVLALLASNNADDATVQQAADEGWTVAETKRRVTTGPKRERTYEQEALRRWEARQKPAPDEVLALESQMAPATDRELLECLGTDCLPKDRRVVGGGWVFQRRSTGGWVRWPAAVPVAAEPIPEPPAAPEPQQPLLVMESAECGEEVMSISKAAERFGIERVTLNAYLCPGRNTDGIVRDGYRITRAQKGMVRLTPVGP